MELYLSFDGSEDIVSRWRRPRREVLELVTQAIGRKHYGTTFDFLGVGVVFQDTGLIPLRTRLLRKRKEAEAEVELATSGRRTPAISRSSSPCYSRSYEPSGW